VAKFAARKVGQLVNLLDYKNTRTYSQPWGDYTMCRCGGHFWTTLLYEGQWWMVCSACQEAQTRTIYGLKHLPYRELIK
jgi:hypothetical protein